MGINSKTLTAKTEDEQKALCAQWAATYDDEMEEHDLASYKSVVEKLGELLPSYSSNGKVRIFGAGCGSGLLGQHVHKMSSLGTSLLDRQKLHITGLDLSPDMVDLAKAKACFDDLHVGSLKEPLGFQEDSFDFVLSSGVFIPGHCGSECIPMMLAPLRADGYAIFTVREAMYKDECESFQEAIESSGCRLLEAPLMPYYGGMQANVLVLKKIQKPEVKGSYGFVSSNINEQTLNAKTENEQKELYAQWAATYDKEMEAHELESYKSVVKKFSDLLASYNRDHTVRLTVFDAGCGSGLLGHHVHVLSSIGALPLDRQKMHITGLDLSHEMVALAKDKECYDDLHVGSLKEPLNFEKDSFDFVLSSGVFIPGHCGAECIPMMLAPVRTGGHAILQFERLCTRMNSNPSKRLSGPPVASCLKLH